MTSFYRTIINTLLTALLISAFLSTQSMNTYASVITAGKGMSIEMTESENREEKETNNEEESIAETIAETATEFAEDKEGMPYSMTDRDSGYAYDCSSLVYYAYKSAGLDISYDGSNTAAEMARGLELGGCAVAANDIIPGDLIFYSLKRNGRYKNISHVSMYVGNGMQVEASGGLNAVITRPVTLEDVVTICRPTKFIMSLRNCREINCTF